MNILLWVLQVLLALAFFAHGWLFLFPPASTPRSPQACLYTRNADDFAGLSEMLEIVSV
jgi:uncharacterized membrane protein YphA (DoxX/SURF4 family)